MIYKLNGSSVIEKLLSFPKTGVEYHRVDVDLKDGTILKKKIK